MQFFQKISREEAGRKIIITHDSKPHVRFPLNAVKQNYRSVTNDLLHVGGIVSSPSKPEFFKIFFPLISLTNARLRVSFLYLIINNINTGVHSARSESRSLRSH